MTAKTNFWSDIPFSNPRANTPALKRNTVPNIQLPYRCRSFESPPTIGSLTYEAPLVQRQRTHCVRIPVLERSCARWGVPLSGLVDVFRARRSPSQRRVRWQLKHLAVKVLLNAGSEISKSVLLRVEPKCVNKGDDNAGKAADVSAFGLSATAIAPTSGVSPARKAWTAPNLFAREYKLRCAASRRMFSGEF